MYILLLVVKELRFIVKLAVELMLFIISVVSKLKCSFFCFAVLHVPYSTYYKPMMYYKHTYPFKVLV